MSYSYRDGFAISINYAIGTGAFALPFALIQAGSVLSLICLSLFAVISCVCLSYVVESMARVGGLIDGSIDGSIDRSGIEQKYSINKQSINQSISLEGSKSYGSINQSTPLLFNQSNNQSINPSHHSLNQSTYHAHIPSTPKIDYVLMCQLLGGRSMFYFVHFCMSLYSVGVLWAYAAVFSSSIDSIVFEYAFGEKCNIYSNPSWNCNFGYVVSVLVFAVFVTYLSLQDISEQANLQKYLTGYRFAALGAMIGTCMYALYFPNPFDKHASINPPTIARIDTVNWSGFPLIFSVSAVALDLHWNSPDIISPLKFKEKCLSMILAALSLSALLYGVIAVVCASVFGQQTLPLVTLNWSDYTGHQGGWGKTDSVPIWAVFMKLFIVCFPILNQLSVYPLVVVTLGDNFLTLIPDSWNERYSATTIKTGCRLVACLPPIAFALFFGKLDAIFAFTGLFAFALVFVVPCWLQLASSRAVQERFGPGSDKTIYSTIFNRPIIVCMVLLFGITAFIVSCVNLGMGMAV